MRNLHKAYYKDYFFGLDYLIINSKGNQGEIKKRNMSLVSAKLECIPNEMIGTNKVKDPKEVKGHKQVLPYVVAYPGLVTGVGIKHEAKIEGEFKLGVHFDYTYGMPVIYGSSVKGVLSYYFQDIVNDMFSESIPSGISVQAVYEDIFKGIRDGKSKSVYERDIFFDAVITKEDENNRILVSDSITPHTKGPLKDPTPLTFVKIAPGCTLEFRFNLKDSIISAETKLEIFGKIIETFGVGAKTNVGYGQFEVNTLL